MAEEAESFEPGCERPRWTTQKDAPSKTTTITKNRTWHIMIFKSATLKFKQNINKLNINRIYMTDS